MNSIWTLVGIALLTWVGWDLYHGYTLATDFIYRAEEPVKYWIVLGVWFLLAISCFFSWGKDASDEDDWSGESLDGLDIDDWSNKDD